MKKMAKEVLILTAVLLMVLVTAACQSSSKFIGTWTLRVDKSTLPSMTEEEASAADAYYAQMSFNLTLKGNGTATANGSFIQTSGQSDALAQWTQNGDTITLTDPSAEASSKTMVFVLRDGKLYFDTDTMGEDLKYFYLVKES